MFTANTFMQTMAKNPTHWSMAGDRELIALSKTHTLKALVDHFKCRPKAILAKAKRLGLSIKHKAK
jgi:hypothetical protein